ncbi:hypothetical protein EN809_031940 [Mesorhizobium sp. M2E.F.Ca.ET.166.01.1.1]|nr:hypothetical protein EN862_031560 [Mesorhizobium sp. M2E.F.Ca.ET.219.01.1.1]TGT65460.1 hypothetical protein EN809_031940 [Mesorhizobium sp. M2E.F.Ca.ET.166.01.1.1]TGV97506.1 hypothetical protein EN797_031950 [Mesorhizobium sp. M2E.F.Ca.ET.154.01.1.1]
MRQSATSHLRRLANTKLKRKADGSQRRRGPSALRPSDLVRARYRYFGPTLAREKLLEWHQIAVSTETLLGTGCGR